MPASINLLFPPMMTDMEDIEYATLGIVSGRMYVKLCAS
jgi:hypothetical protein